MMLLATVTCATAACTASPALEARVHAQPSAQAYAQLGAWFGEKGQYECAIDALEAGLRIEPNSTSLNYYLGLSLFSSGRREEAIAPLDHAAELDSKALQPRLILATVFSQLRRNDEARAQWQAALHIDPSSSAALDGLAKSMNSSGDYAATINLLRPSRLNEDLALDLAFAFAKTGKLESASRTLNVALRTAPSSVRLTSALAKVYIEQHIPDSANELLKKFLRAHPGDIELQRIWLPLLILHGEFSVAQPVAKRLLAVDPHNFDVVFLNGILEHQAADYPPARAHLEEAVSLNPNDSSAHYYLGLTLIGLEDNQGAREELEKSVALDPLNREAHFQLANILRTLGEKKLALEQSNISQQLFQSQAQRALAKTKADLANTKMAAGDTKGAIALYREALEIAPQESMIAYRLAVALDGTGDTAGERTTLLQAIAIDPNLALAQNQLGYLISRDGDATGAEEHFRVAIKSDPGYTEAWVNLAAALAMQSRFTEAQQALDSALRLDPANAQARGLKKDLPTEQSRR